MTLSEAIKILEYHQEWRLGTKDDPRTKSINTGGKRDRLKRVVQTKSFEISKSAENVCGYPNAVPPKKRII